MRLRIHLRSDSAFGRGDGVAGLVDTEVEHDARTGLPYIKGRTIKGLLVESCANILYGLENGDNHNRAYEQYKSMAENLFGVGGSTLEAGGNLHIGNAELPQDFRQYIQKQIVDEKFTAQQILQSFTTIRHQTAIDPETDKPRDGSLRATRVVLRETVFYSELYEIQPLSSAQYELLAACAAGIKRGGQNRTRGLGWLDVSLIEVDGDPLNNFIQAIGGAV